jgi:hypothetical protein
MPAFCIPCRLRPKGGAAILAVPNCIYATSASLGRFGLQGHGDVPAGLLRTPARPAARGIGRPPGGQRSERAQGTLRITPSPA